MIYNCVPTAKFVPYELLNHGKLSIHVGAENTVKTVASAKRHTKYLRHFIEMPFPTCRFWRTSDRFF